MHTSEQCQGKGCERRTECERYTDTKDWPFPVMSKLCDSRFVAFLPKVHVGQIAHTAQVASIEVEMDWRPI